jgi:hypothetical protein
MARTSFKLFAGLTVCFFAAASAPACGGDSDDDGKAGSGGKDAGPDTGTGGVGGAGGGGGTGGASGGAGGSGGGDGAASITCGSDTCKPYSVVIAELPPCCAGSGKDKCGVELDESIAGTIGIQAGCFELNQAGNADPSCPPLTGVPVIGSLPGCCNAAASQCSYQVDISGLGGPNMGCVDPKNVPNDGGTPTSCIPGQPGDSGTDADTDAGDAATDAATDGATEAATDAATDAASD